MLTLTIPRQEGFDEKKQEFVVTEEQTLVLEHSLVSLSKWEAKHNIPFMTKKEKTEEEMLDYILCMTVTKGVDKSNYAFLTSSNIKAISDYIEAPMTATTFGEGAGTSTPNRKIVTSELIYYWMTAFNIPFECQKWHINRLLTLIKICEEENKDPKKKKTQDIAKRNAALNAQRRQKLNTRG